ncbi:PREDICTED: uncharacterized protein LOC106743391, partial [Dinoponera quadriceps]|uniref:Uncharacterized protein LOC106743391 n=1 Tax=Dinoponera quadriceps TaxID=609295 RepID=A0A6P3X2Y9_DINQU
MFQFQYGAGGRSNQLAASAPRVKLRRACQQQQHHQHYQLAQRPFVSTSANCRGDEPRPRTMPAKPATRISDNPKGSLKQRSAMVTSTASALPSNVTRHFVRTMNGGYLNNPESPYVSHHQQAIRDYLNQTMPLPAQRHLRARDRAIYQATGGRNNLVDRSCTVAADVGTTGDHRRAARGQGGRLQQRHSVDAGCIDQRKLSSTCDRSKFLDSSSQRHGVIAASVYKELCNGSIG